MKSVIRRLLCVLAVLLVVASFACCGGKEGDDPDEMVTIRWAIFTGEQEDTQMVMEEVNKKLAEKLPNTEIEMILDSSMATKWPMWMAGGDEIDLAHAGFVTDIQTEINNESYMPLNDLIEEYAPTLKEQREGIFKDLYNCGTYKGELYAVPIPQIYVKDTLTITIPDELAHYLDIPAVVDECYGSSTTTEKLYELLDEFLTKAKEAGTIGTDKISSLINPETMYALAKRGYEFIGGENSAVCYKMASEGDVTIIDFHTTEEFKAYVKWMSKWNKDGFVSKDILTGGTAGSKMYLIECHNLDRMTMGEDHTFVKTDGVSGVDRRYICVTNPENDYRGSSTLGYLQTYVAIPTTSTHPERAIQLLDLLYSEEGSEILNLLNYGIEGVHYEKTADNVIAPFDYIGQATSSSKYGLPPWTTANMFNAYIVAPYTQETYDYAVNYFENENAKRPTTPLYGFFFDSAELTLDLSNVGLVNAEYELQLTSGVFEDYASVYDTLLSKTKSSGLDKIIAEYQKQADEYIASK